MSRSDRRRTLHQPECGTAAGSGWHPIPDRAGCRHGPIPLGGVAELWPHASGPNESDEPRWSIISAHNRLSNRPINPDEPVSSVAPISRVPDAAILDPAAAGVSAGADFLDKSRRKYQERKD